MTKYLKKMEKKIELTEEQKQGIREHELKRAEIVKLVQEKYRLKPEQKKKKK